MSIINRLGSDMSSFGNAVSDRQRLVAACCQELRQRGISWDPQCPVEDLLRAALDQHALLPPADFPSEEAAYWAKFEGLLRDPRWRRCQRTLRLASSRQRFEAAAAVFVLGLLGRASFFCRKPVSKSTTQQRSQLADMPELSLSPLTELMAGVSIQPTGDHRMLDLAAVSLYQAALPLDVQNDAYLMARLQQLRRLMRGLRPEDDNMAVSGLYGVTSQGNDLANVVLAELADQRLFAIKFANDELMYWRRMSPSEKEPRVRFRVFVDPRLANGCKGADGHSLVAWAKALSLWFCHDLLCYVAFQSSGIQYEFELLVGDTDDMGPTQRFVFKLPDLFDEFGGQIALDQPFLAQLPSVRPSFLRGQARTVKDGDNEPGNGDLYGAPTGPRKSVNGRNGNGTSADTDRQEPIFAFDLLVSSTTRANVDQQIAFRHEARRSAALRLTETSCELASEHASGPAVVACHVDRLCDIRRLLLRRVVDQMLTTATSL